jgi:general secretion pathway protein D/MSHA biogenesis protein MshL
LEDEAGYEIKPVDITIKAGRPYLQVGAELKSKYGKVPLAVVIKKLTDLKGLSVSWAADVDQTKLVDVDVSPADNFWDALDNILRQVDYFYETAGRTLIVNYKETRKYHVNMPSVTETFTSSLGGNMLPTTGTEGAAGIAANTQLTVNSPEFSFWTELENSLGTIMNCSDCPKPVIDKALGIVTITAPRRTHREVERYLASLEKEAHRQVIIEAKILEIGLTKDHSTGVDWENIFSNKTFTGSINLKPTLYAEGGSGPGRLLKSVTVSTPVSWQLIVSAFREYGDTRTLANPKVSLMNGHSAVLSAGQQNVYLSGCDVAVSETGVITSSTPITNSVTEGLTVGIKPNITDTQEVVLYVFPAVTRLIRMVNIGVSACGTIQAPETSVREMATYAKVKNGEILIIGGLIQSRILETKKKVPVLGNLPLLGGLFRYESMTDNNLELVILIRPRIISSKGVLVERQNL